ncbi:MAG: HD domain-containing protein, partial [Candidatus Dojkabacteria bacterium]|nr:HD domain-containing protein [Candidatus Dojkabacteria bacterium]
KDFVIHTVNTALITAQMGCDTSTIIASILHSLAGKEIEMNEIKSIFGDDIYNLILETKKIQKATKNIETPEEIITKYILHRSKDLRPVLIKLASALHNVKTVQYLPEEEQRQASKRVFNVYSIIAEYLNLNDMKKELEEYAFKQYQPVEYESIKNKMLREDINQGLLNKYWKKLEEYTNGMDIKILGRVKGEYSIYNKLKKYEKEWKDPKIEELTDLIAFRVVTKSNDDCFLVLEKIMDNSQVNTDLFDDYISNPKPNGYMAIHTVTKFPDISNLGIEVQILTEDMEYTNTYGKASHISYKAQKSRYAKPTDEYSWVEDVHNKIKEHISKREDNISNPILCNIFENDVYVFTPKEEIIPLDKGDTALDFAYKVHSDIGNSAVGAKINGLAGRLDTVLKTDEKVEIKIQKDKDSQPISALSFVHNPSSKSKILRSLSKKKKN